MDFTLSSSTVLGAAVLLWLLWGAPYLLRRARSASDGATLLAEAIDPDQAPTTMIGSAQRMPAGRTEPVLSPSTPPARQSPEEGQHVTDRNPAVGKLRLRWGRCVLALGGVAGLLLAVVGGLLAALHVVGPVAPLVGLGATVAAVVVLRRLALSDRRRRLEARRRASRSTAQPAPAPEVSRRVASEVFDHQPEPEPVAPPLSRDELRAAALEVARAAQEAAAEAASQTGADEGETWEPVDVPKPSYMEAAKAERNTPAPIDHEQPKPAGKVTIKPKPEADDVPGVPNIPAARPAAKGALGNLDAVLQRRRA